MNIGTRMNNYTRQVANHTTQTSYAEPQDNRTIFHEVSTYYHCNSSYDRSYNNTLKVLEEPSEIKFLMFLQQQDDQHSRNVDGRECCSQSKTIDSYNKG